MSIRILILGILFGWISPVLRAEPVAVQILLQDDKRRVGFVSNSNDRALLFQMSANVREQGEAIPYERIRAVSFTDEGEIMGPSQFAYSRGRYEEAERAFAKIAKKYGFLWGIGREIFGNFACEARFFQIDCLRRLGRYEEIATAMETETGKAMEKGIPETLVPELEMFGLWNLYAQGKWDELASKLKGFESSFSAKEAEYLSVPPFKEGEPGKLVQLHFLRAGMFEKKGKTSEAIDDYYRAITLNFAADAVIAKDSLEKVLSLETQRPEGEQDRKQLYGPAIVFKDMLNRGSIKPQWSHLSVKREN